MSDFERLLSATARLLRERAATVHERQPCPKCGAAVGDRCYRMGRTGTRGAPLKHPHAERVRLEVPLR